MTQFRERSLPRLPEAGNLWRTDQLRAAGLNSRAICHLMAQDELVRLRWGCYHAHAHGTLTTSTGGFVYSHTSGARLHGLFLWDVDGLIHILFRVSPSSQRLGKDVRGHTRPYADTEVTDLGPGQILRLQARCRGHLPGAAPEKGPHRSRLALRPGGVEGSVPRAGVQSPGPRRATAGSATVIAGTVRER